MRMLIMIIVLLKCLFVQAQINFTAIDTSVVCKTGLSLEYKLKFERANKNLVSLNSDVKNVIKEVYTEIQDNFLEKINNNNFICDNNINPYLQKLMEEILSKNNIKKDGYRILLSRNSSINAYNTGDGTVVIHYGLFLILDNEDELVFIISHEIGHQYLGHVKTDIENYAKLTTSAEIIAKTKDIKRQKFGKATKANDLLKGLTYQKYDIRRKKEIAADSLGLVFYKKTLRNPKAAIVVLEKLDDSDKEKDTLMPADYKSIFEKGGFIVKQKYFEEEQSLFVKYDKDKRIDVDSLKSHPDCITRIKLIKNYLDDAVSENYSNSTNFSDIKKNSTYQNLMNLYNAQEYGISLYEALKLYKHNPENEVLKNIIYINLIKIYDSRANYTINKYVPRHDNLNNTASLNRFISFVSSIKMADFEIIINNFKS